MIVEQLIHTSVLLCTKRHLANEIVLFFLWKKNTKFETAITTKFDASSVRIKCWTRTECEYDRGIDRDRTVHQQKKSVSCHGTHAHTHTSHTKTRSQVDGDGDQPKNGVVYQF